MNSNGPTLAQGLAMGGCSEQGVRGGGSPARPSDDEGRGAAGVAAAQGGESSLVDSGDSSEFLKHGEREEGVRS
jgi:hypothetical protein